MCNRCRVNIPDVKFFSRRDLEPNELSPQDIEDHDFEDENDE